MKRLATTFLVGMAAVGWCATVRMGALSTDTTVETLGEGAAAVQLVSKAKIDSMIEALSVGSDGTWLELNGSTGTIYQIVREVGVEGDKSHMIVTGASADYNGPVVGSVFEKDAGSETWRYLIFSIDFDSDDCYLRHNQIVAFSWVSTNVTESSVPVTLSKAGRASKGSVTVDWYGIKTNAFQIALVDDIPAMSGYATTGDVAAVAATIPDVAASTNWLTRAGLSGTVAFANDGGRPQAWNGTGALTVSGFTGLQPPAQVYWTLYGFDSVTLPASSYVVGGGAWQTNMVNHFTVWQVGTNVMLNFITATEAD